MKLRISILTLIAGTGMLAGCHGDLDIAQKSQITSVSMWKTESDAIGAVYGVYAQLRSTLADSYIYYGDLRTNLYGGGMMSEPAFDKMGANVLTRDLAGTNWVSFYTTINDCNLVLKKVPSISFNSDAKRNEVLANAYFVRGFLYFWIARIWGDAPVLTSGFESDNQEDLYPARAPQAQVFAQAEADINKAVELMPRSVSELKTGSWGAVNMLKADYYLWKAKRLNGGRDALLAAQTALNEVLAGPYVLAPQFKTVFSNEEDPEHIFSIDFTRDEYTGGFASMYLIPLQYVSDDRLVENPVKVGSHQQYLSITDAYEAFLSAEAKDTRTDVSFMVYQDVENRFRWINKFVGEWANDTRFFTSDIPVYRLAEALLMKAEVENALGNTPDAVGYLNDVAERAYGVEDYYPANLSAAEVDEKIVDETMKEFVSEGKIWWAFVRFGVAFDRVATLTGREDETNLLLWPVASACINTNPKIEQTEGYN